MYHGQSSKTEIDKRREAKAAAELQKLAQDNKVREGTLLLLYCCNKVREGLL